MAAWGEPARHASQGDAGWPPPPDMGAANGAPVDTYVDSAARSRGEEFVKRPKKTLVATLRIDSTNDDIRTVAKALADLIKSPSLTDGSQNNAGQMRVATEVYGQITMLFQLGDSVKGAMIEELGRLVGSPAALQMRLELADSISHDGTPLFSWRIAVDSVGMARDLSLDAAAKGAQTVAVEATASEAQIVAIDASSATKGSNGKRIGNPGKKRRKAVAEKARKPNPGSKPALATPVETPIARLIRLFAQHRDLINLLGRVEAFNRLLAESFDQVATILRRDFGGNPQKKEAAERFLRRIIRDGIGDHSGLDRKDLPKALALALAAPAVGDAEKVELVSQVDRIMTVGSTKMLRPELNDRIRALFGLVKEINDLPANQRAERIPALLFHIPAVNVSNVLDSISRMLEDILVRYVFGEPLPPEQVATVSYKKSKPVVKAASPDTPSIGEEDPAAVTKIVDNLRIIRHIVEYIGKSTGSEVLVLSAAEIARWESSYPGGFKSFISARREIYLELEQILSMDIWTQDDIIQAIRDQMSLNTEQLRFLIRKLNLLVRGYDASYTIAKEGRRCGFKKLGSAWSFAAATSPSSGKFELVNVLRTNFHGEMARLSSADVQRLAGELTRDFWKLSSAEQATFGKRTFGEIPLSYVRTRVAALYGATAEGMEGEAARRERDPDAEKERGREEKGRAEDKADQSRPGEVK